MGLFRNCTRPIDAASRVSRRNVTVSLLLCPLILATTGRPILAQQLAKAENPIRIVAFGDSLTAGYGLAPSDAFPAQLERALKSKGLNVEIINAGVSGDTTSAALERFDWAIPDGVDAAIVELGANDALRGQPPEQAKKNLDTILSRLREKGIEVLLTGIPAPRNWGDGYVKSFDPMFAELSKKHNTLLYPFFLDGVALKPELSLPDGLHPNARGVALIADRIGGKVDELLERVAIKRRNAGKI